MDNLQGNRFQIGERLFRVEFFPSVKKELSYLVASWVK